MVGRVTMAGRATMTVTVMDLPIDADQAVAPQTAMEGS